MPDDNHYLVIEPHSDDCTECEPNVRCEACKIEGRIGWSIKHPLSCPIFLHHTEGMCWLHGQFPRWAEVVRSTAGTIVWEQREVCHNCDHAGPAVTPMFGSGHDCVFAHDIEAVGVDAFGGVSELPETPGRYAIEHWFETFPGGPWGPTEYDGGLRLREPSDA